MPIVLAAGVVTVMCLTTYLGARVVGSARGWIAARRRPSTADDPFEVLWLQLRLSALAAEIRTIEQDQTSLARAHHLRACQHAYDSLLWQATLLVGLGSTSGSEPVTMDSARIFLLDEDTRMHQELDLCARGWSW